MAFNKVRELFGVESEGSSEPEIPLLSEILQSRGNYIPQAELEPILAYASELRNPKETIRPDEEKWLTDFIRSIHIVLEAEWSMNQQVLERARQNQSEQRDSQVRGLTTFKVGESPKPPLPPRPKTPPESKWLDTRSPSQSAREVRALPIPSIKMNELAIRPDIFKGVKSEARGWIEDYEAAANSNGWSDALRVKYFPTFLSKTARDWYTGIAQPRLGANATYSSLRSMFVRYYIGPEEEMSIRMEIERTKQRHDEPSTEFIARMIRLLNMSDEHQNEKTQVLIVRSKLRGVIQARMTLHKPTTVEELNDACLEIERSIELAEKGRDRRNPQRQTNESRDLGKKGPRQRDGSTRDNAGSEGKPRVNKLKCAHCSKVGHEEATCYKKNGYPKDNRSQAKNNAQHATAAVRANTSQVPNIKVTHGTSAVVVAATSVVEEVSIMRNVSINQKKFSAMIDTGSKMSLIRSDIVSSLGLKADGSAISLVGADSNRLGVEGFVQVNLALKLGNTRKEVDIRMAVVDNLCVPVLLGWELLGWFKVMISLEDRKVWFSDEQNGVRLRRDVELPARNQSVVEAMIPAQVGTNCAVLIVPTDLDPAIIVANTVASVQNDSSVQCLIANVSATTVTLGKNTEIARYEIVEKKQNENIEARVSAVLNLPTTNEVVQVGDSLSPAQLLELQQLLQDKVAAFSVNGRIGETNIIEHDIDLLPDAKPIVEPLRRRPLIHKEEAKRQVNKMLEDGIVERSSSPWAAAYVLVKKKTGDMRLCIDFRRLNDKTKKNVYPLPNIEDCLEPLSGNMYFSQLDLASGYWQIKMAEKAKELTAFRTEDGLFQFRRMPFGLCNAPASFQRLVNALFTGLKGVHLQVFIDDICVATPTWKEHLLMLEQVFTLLINANLTLKASKCCFGSDRVIFLGHELSKDGIKQDPAKLKAMIDLPTPRNVAELRRVLGMFGYYRRFVPRYAQLSEPLNRLMKKEVEYVWQTKQQQAFTMLKEALSRNMVLAHFTHTEPVALKTILVYQQVKHQRCKPSTVTTSHRVLTKK